MRLKAIIPFIIFGSFTIQAQNNSTFKEYKKIFTTYPFSDPDPIPKPESKIYPYFRFDGFTDKPIEQEWKVVEIENDYIKLMILPEIGGKVWSAVEKKTGKDFVYNNHVIKFRDIAMRGPWTSGGVEGNYGIIGHTTNCATPVDYKIINKKDGSISCVIGVLDLLTRTYWKLDINLPKDKAYFTTSSFWTNTTELEQPYYTWMNTGIKAADNLEFIFPGKNYLGHGGEHYPWPLDPDNGKNLSIYKNNDFGGYKSYHVFGKYTDFFAGFYHDENFGMGRSGNYGDKPGKKVWIWGLSQQGMLWEKLLTDTDGQYVEVQSGRLFNQEGETSIYTPFKHRSFAPQQTDTWTEYWFPVKETKGVVKANHYGSVNVKTEQGWLKIYFSPLQNTEDDLEVFEDGRKIYSKKLNLKTLETFKDSIQIAVNKDKLKLVIGTNKLVYNSDPTDGNISRPMDLPADFDHNSMYGLYQQGKNYSSFKDYKIAQEKLEACLKLDPNFAPALVELSTIQIRNRQYQKALESASRALAIDTYLPAANYNYATANLHLANMVDAKEAYEIAATSIEFRSAAYNALAKIHFTEGNVSKAKEFAEKSLLFNQQNIEALQVLTLIAKSESDQSASTAYLDAIETIDPLNHFVGFERYRVTNTELSKKQFIALVQNEMPEQSFLELAIWYYKLNQNTEALKVLEVPTANIEIAYWKAFLSKSAINLSNYKVGTSFPFREETALVLEKLINNSSPWQMKYHLALIEWNRGHLDNAKKLFIDCGTKIADPAFYAAKADLFKSDPKVAEENLKTAIKLDPKSWRYPKLLAEHYIVQKQNQKALATIEPFYKKNQENYVIGMLYGKTLLLNKKYSTADKFLTTLKILPFEGATIGRLLYHEAKLMQALAEIKNKQYKKAIAFIEDAKLFPENLGVGKPYDADIDQRLENWLDYLCYSKLGDSETANKKLDSIISFVPRIDNTVMNFLPANQLISAWAIEKKQNQNEAEKWLKKQTSLFPTNKIVQWTYEMFTKKQSSLLTDDEKDGEVRVIENL